MLQFNDVEFHSAHNFNSIPTIINLIEDSKKFAKGKGS